MPPIPCAAGAALFGLTAAPALAQTVAQVDDGVAGPAAVDAQAAPAKPKPKAKTPAGAPTVAVTVTNSRKADLVQLQATEGHVDLRESQHVDMSD